MIENSCTLKSSMKAFCATYRLCSLVKEATFFKNPDNPACIDLLLTNKQTSFQRLYAMETGLSGFYKMELTVMKMHFPKRDPRIITYWHYKNFHSEHSWLLYSMNVTKKELFYMTMVSMDALSNICTNVREKHAPSRKRY